jgi:hypothetical protein
MALLGSITRLDRKVKARIRWDWGFKGKLAGRTGGEAWYRLANPDTLVSVIHPDLARYLQRRRDADVGYWDEEIAATSVWDSAWIMSSRHEHGLASILDLLAHQGRLPDRRKYQHYGHECKSNCGQAGDIDLVVEL